MVGNIETLITNMLVFLFSKHRCLVFTSFNQTDYYKMVTKLRNHGVSYRTRITSHNTGMMVSSRNDLNQYDIFVKKTEEDLAARALNSEF
jgi:hypothetical protein